MAATFELPFSLNYSDLSTSSPSDVDDTFADDLLSDFGGDDAFGPRVTPNAPTTDAGASKRRSRRHPSTAAKRATHNAIERARRESLNGRFIELARALPNMASVKRPSKSAIVIKSLEFVHGVQSREQQMKDQNAALRREVEDLKARLGQAQTQTQTAFDVGAFVQRSPVSSDGSLSPASSAMTPPPVELSPSAVDYFANLFVAPTISEFNFNPAMAVFDWNTAPVVPFGPPIYA
jgi:hypothetical protein